MISYFISLLYPTYCEGCGRTLVRGEECLCLYCLENLPRTDFHHYKDNPVEMVFAGQSPVFRATAFCFFNKGNIMQKLIHQLKYKDNKAIGFYLGHQFGLELAKIEAFQSIDLIIPVPLHPKKFRQRGYNQSECIGKGISETLSKPMDTSSIIRVTPTSTQTKKARYQRWENVSGIFQLTDPNALTGKHILLVDDVITTGATIEAAARLLLTLPWVKVSVACLAYAGN
ncbi:MAG: ComF family protein [Bacteroidales bacterium]|jgi:ComF family protein|nr:ComF family protein [Bacteroidales bacterium]